MINSPNMSEQPHENIKQNFCFKRIANCSVVKVATFVVEDT